MKFFIYFYLKDQVDVYDLEVDLWSCRKSQIFIVKLILYISTIMVIGAPFQGVVDFYSLSYWVHYGLSNQWNAWSKQYEYIFLMRKLTDTVCSIRILYDLTKTKKLIDNFSVMLTNKGGATEYCRFQIYLHKWISISIDIRFFPYCMSIEYKHSLWV